MIQYRLHLNKLLPVNPITVEVGVAEALFSNDILREWKPDIHFLVDTWQTIRGQRGDGSFPQSWHDENFKKAELVEASFKNAFIKRKLSSVAVKEFDNNFFDLVYLDADHSYRGVMNDIKAWISKLKIGGIMAFHDYLATNYGVKRAVDEYAKKHGFTVNIIPENKPEDAGAWFRVEKH